MNNGETPSPENGIEQRAEEREHAEDGERAENVESDKNPEQDILDAIGDAKETSKNIDVDLPLESAKRHLSALESVLPPNSRISREAEDVMSELSGSVSEVSELMLLIESVQTDGMGEGLSSKVDRVNELTERASAKIALLTENIENYAQRLVRYTIDQSEGLGNSVYEIEEVSRGIIDTIPGLSESRVKLKQNSDRWRTVADDIRRYTEQKRNGV